MGEATALILRAILTLLAVEPEAAQLGLDLLFPAAFAFAGNAVPIGLHLLKLTGLVNGRLETLAHVEVLLREVTLRVTHRRGLCVWRHCGRIRLMVR